MQVRYCDIHSHIHDHQFDADRGEVLARMKEARVATIAIGTDYDSSARAVALAEREENVFSAIGRHPNDNRTEVFDDAAYRALASHERVVAIGECGLDYYWPAHHNWNEGGEVAEKRRQRDLFERQIAFSGTAGKPLMIHGRPTKGSMDAYEDILEILAAYPDVVGNVHFFVGDTNIAHRFVDRGFTMSFTGVLTFTHDYDETVRYLPRESIMAETDSPYVAPVPHRGARNEPVYVIETVKTIARIRNEQEDAVRNALMENVRRVFGTFLTF